MLKLVEEVKKLQEFATYYNESAMSECVERLNEQFSAAEIFRTIAGVCSEPDDTVAEWEEDDDDMDAKFNRMIFAEERDWLGFLLKPAPAKTWTTKAAVQGIEQVAKSITKEISSKEMTQLVKFLENAEGVVPEIVLLTLMEFFPENVGVSVIAFCKVLGIPNVSREEIFSKVERYLEICMESKSFDCFWKAIKGTELEDQFLQLYLKAPIYRNYDEDCVSSIMGKYYGKGLFTEELLYAASEGLYLLGYPSFKVLQSIANTAFSKLEYSHLYEDESLVKRLCNAKILEKSRISEIAQVLVYANCQEIFGETYATQVKLLIESGDICRSRATARLLIEMGKQQGYENLVSVAYGEMY